MNNPLVKQEQFIPWSAERAAEMLRLDAAGVPAKEIAGILGITYGAVKGKLKRLGKTKIKARRHSVAVLPPQGKTATNFGPVSLLDSLNKQCRWPIDEVQREPPFLTYCGQKSLDGGNYCDEHSKRMFSRPYKEYD